MRPELQKKINFAIRLLKAYDNLDEPVEIAYSGGKDSDVILQLAKEAGINFRAIYRNTTIDPPGTVKHAKDMGVEVRRPDRTFFQIIQAHGLPSRVHRFCCGYLKEFKILDKCVMGIRKEESPKRAERYKEPSQCRFYGSKREHVEAIYPILEWTTQDVTEFLQDRKIKCAPRYYDEQGKFHPERRLGCIGCPLAYRSKRVEEFRQYPGILKQYVRNLGIFRQTHPNTKVVTDFFDNEYEQMYFDLFLDSYEEFVNQCRGGLFARPDCKQFLENYFKIKL